MAVCMCSLNIFILFSILNNCDGYISSEHHDKPLPAKFLIQWPDVQEDPVAFITQRTFIETNLVPALPFGSQVILATAGQTDAHRLLIFNVTRNGTQSKWIDPLHEYQRTNTGVFVSAATLKRNIMTWFPKKRRKRRQAEIMFIVVSSSAHLVNPEILEMFKKTKKTYVFKGTNEWDQLATDRDHVFNISDVNNTSFQNVLSIDTRLRCNVDQFSNPLTGECQSCTSVCRMSESPGNNQPSLCVGNCQYFMHMRWEERQLRRTTVTVEMTKLPILNDAQTTASEEQLSHHLATTKGIDETSNPDDSSKSDNVNSADETDIAKEYQDDSGEPPTNTSLNTAAKIIAVIAYVCLLVVMAGARHSHWGRKRRMDEQKKLEKARHDQHTASMERIRKLQAERNKVNSVATKSFSTVFVSAIPSHTNALIGHHLANSTSPSHLPIEETSVKEYLVGCAVRPYDLKDAGTFELNANAFPTQDIHECDRPQDIHESDRPHDTI